MAKDQDFEKDFVRLKNVSKIYRMGEVEIRAVDKIEFAIDKGEFVVVVGPSGAGKTTVLNILGGMDTVTSGDVLVDGENIAKYSQRKLTGYRRDDIGFVFQFYNLVPNRAGLFLYCGRTRQEDHTDRAGQKGGHDLCVCIGRTAAGEGNGYSERQAGCR